jgi:glucosamine kinase
MILVADSGSSKTNWLLQLPDSSPLEYKTKGINPFYFTEKEIIKILNSSEAILKYSADVKEVHFFGAGCSSPDRREIVSNALSAVFKNAYVNVENNELGCIYATCGNNRGITCNLGTGSNSAYFDGERVHYSKQGLGFILGDEGSAAYFGKILITAYLYDELPKDLKKDFEKIYKLDKEIVINHVYQKPTPNWYLASFADFLIKNKSHRYVKELLTNGFEEFFNENVTCFPSYQYVPCHFVGSVAFNFQDILKEVCSKYGVKPGKILEQPIREIYDFVLARELQSTAV